MHIPIYSRFIGGMSVQQSIAMMESYRWIPIFDLVKEGAKDKADVLRYKNKIMVDIKTMVQKKPAFLALKLSSFGDQSADFGDIRDVVSKALDHGIDILMDAETTRHTDREDAIVDALYSDGLPVYKTYQMYRKDSVGRLLKDLESETITRFKLVRGAYMMQEDKSKLFDRKQKVDMAYSFALRNVLEAIEQRSESTAMIATHNAESIDETVRLLKKNPQMIDRVYFAQLLGMADKTSEKLISGGFRTCKYVPYGSLFDSLPYLTRRLIENYDIVKHI